MDDCTLPGEKMRATLVKDPFLRRTNAEVRKRQCGGCVAHLFMGQTGTEQLQKG
jgi:hypothetical protein